MTREKSWIEGLAALTITEWANDDRLLQDLGGGLSSRMAKRWMDDLGFGWEQMPNFKVHSEADEEHSDMFLEDLEKFAIGREGIAGLSSGKRVHGVAENIPCGNCARDGKVRLGRASETR